MRFDTDQVALKLEKAHSLRICGAMNTRIDCEDGCLWITQDNDIRDIVLQRGDSFTLDRPGVAILYACSRSSFAMQGAHGVVSPNCDESFGAGMVSPWFSPLFA